MMFSVDSYWGNQTKIYITSNLYIWLLFSLIWFYCFASLRFVNTIAVGDVPSLRNPLGATPWLNSRMLASVRPFIFLVFLFPFFFFQLGFCIVRWIHWRRLRKSPFAKTHGDSVPYFQCCAVPGKSFWRDVWVKWGGGIGVKIRVLKWKDNG